MYQKYPKTHQISFTDQEMLTRANQALVKLSQEKNSTETALIKLQTNKVKWFCYLLVSAILGGLFTFYYGQITLDKITFSLNSTSKTERLTATQDSILVTSSELVLASTLIGSLVFSGIKYKKIKVVENHTQKKIEEANLLFIELSKKISKY